MSSTAPPDLMPEMTEHNWYEILEIQDGSSAEVVNKAGKKQSLAYHPDKNKSADAPAKFLLVQKAKDVLQDPEKKKKYDEWLVGQKKRQRYDEDKSKSMDERRKRMKEELESKINKATSSKSGAEVGGNGGSNGSSTSNSNKAHHHHHHSMQKQYTKEELDTFKQDAIRLREQAAEEQAREHAASTSYSTSKFAASSSNGLGVEKEFLDDVLSNSDNGGKFTEIKVKNRNQVFQSEASLLDQFKPYGRILAAKFFGDKGNCGIISYENHQSALMAIQAYEFSKDFKVTIFSDGKSSKYTSSISSSSGDTEFPLFPSKQSLTEADRIKQRELLLRSLEQEENGSSSIANNRSIFNNSISSSSSSSLSSSSSSSSSLSDGLSDKYGDNNHNSFSNSNINNNSSSSSSSISNGNNYSNYSNSNSGGGSGQSGSFTINNNSNNNTLPFISQENEIIAKMKKIKELTALRRAQAASNTAN